MNNDNQEAHFENMSSLFEEEEARADTKARLEIAKALLQHGVAVSIIETATGLSSDVINTL